MKGPKVNILDSAAHTVPVASTQHRRRSMRVAIHSMQTERGCVSVTTLFKDIEIGI